MKPFYVNNSPFLNILKEAGRLAIANICYYYLSTPTAQNVGGLYVQIKFQLRKRLPQWLELKGIRGFAEPNYVGGQVRT